MHNAQRYTDLTGPISLSFALVGSLSGVEARTQTSPLRSLIAVDRPPTGKMFITEKGLRGGGDEAAFVFQHSGTYIL